MTLLYGIKMLVVSHVLQKSCKAVWEVVKKKVVQLVKIICAGNCNEWSFGAIPFHAPLSRLLLPDRRKNTCIS